MTTQHDEEFPPVYQAEDSIKLSYFVRIDALQPDRSFIFEVMA